MTARLGEVLYWVSVILAGLVLYGVYTAVKAGGSPTDENAIAFYIIAAPIVAIGWALRYILSGRRSV
jgi:hypothetical protein